MIVPMKKIYLVVQDKDVVSTMESLRELGTVHIEHERAPQGGGILNLREKINELSRVISLLSQENLEVDQVEADDWHFRVQEILGFIDLIQQYTEGAARRQAKINSWEPWGEFNPEDVEDLSEKGIVIQFVEVPERDMDRAPAGVILVPIFKQEGVERCLAISRKEVTLPFTTLIPPAVSLNVMISVQQRNKDRITAARKKVREACQYLDDFGRVLAELQEELAFQEVYAGRQSKEKLAVLKGFCPKENSQDIERIALREGWGLLIQDPGAEDQVPTYIRNPRWVELIKPVFGMINIVPGYKEFDISLVFLAFFCVFVGILIGDAGYALIYAILFYYFFQTKKGKSKFKDWFGVRPESKTVLVLLYLLCGCTFFWGVLTGTFFGQQWLPAAFKPILPWLTVAENVQKLCFILGAIHLSIAHAWRFLARLPSLSSFGDLGWLFLVWFMYYGVNMFVLDIPFPRRGWVFLFTGAVLVLFFTKPDKNPLKALGSGIFDMFGTLKIVSSFTDVVSYIRLFAVGLATVAVADAANSNVYLTFPLHTLNLLLAAMAVLVHGLRLNVLEFSSHMSMEWTGVVYHPFRKIKKI